jgi:protein KTI12
MALIMMCGLPCSGKTRRATELAAYFEAAGRQVVLINEESLGMKRSQLYCDLSAEKITRGNFKAAVERSVSKDRVVRAWF